ncbi:hypothetical protein LNKW23_37840 [Paralimibaculum aggregatum]|uniref:Uncharacterized protein n=1 Tax=Paralimibaculum aggregatum TaxID=3036245 RepID=A0ABQ6LRE1_9RHOB|nr:hypothetical protein [Limibaculum sp. NKW23]GMG84568.1 hypothetical protein LNKW23_37840 [Limibaculum sp. NKW23]
MRQLPEKDRAIHAAFEAKGDIEGEIRYLEEEIRRLEAETLREGK